MTSFSRTLALLLVSGALAGCATYERIKAPPAVSQPLSVVVTNDGSSAWDVPLGTYTVPNTNVIISGHQSGNGLVGVLLGPVGMLAMSAADSQAGKSSVGDVASTLRVDLTAQAQDVTQKLLASGKFGQSFTATAGGPSVTLSPFALLTYANDNELRIWAITRATLKGVQKQDWTGRYFASIGKPLPLTGLDSLSANDGALFKAQLSKTLERLIAYTLDDIAAHRARDEKKTETVEFDLPYIRGWRNTLPVPVLTEDEQTIVLAPKYADANITAGIYILDKSQIVRH